MAHTKTSKKSLLYPYILAVLNVMIGKLLPVACGYEIFFSTSAAKKKILHTALMFGQC